MADTTYSQLKRLGRAIRAARAETGLSQEDFAEVVGVHRTYMGHIERGEANLTFQSLARVSTALKLRPSALFLRAGL